jgi:peptidoglycan/xylan/chitin deacetylase (PgdA/CDA1 family)
MPESAKESLFMTWDEARKMHADGMDIGSHSHTHRILSHLSLSEQDMELRNSKAILERELGETVPSIAYPVGAHDSFTPDTERLANDAGYRVAFSFINGINRTGSMPRFALRRIAVDENASPDDIKMATLRATRAAQRLTSLIQSVRRRKTVRAH